MSSTPMEKIKAYHSIKPFVSKNELNEVASMLNLTEVDRTKRVEGKEAEFEFLLMCHLLGKLENSIAFEEGVSRLTNTVTTDFLFITKDNRRLAIEVKSTEKEKWDNITNNRLTSQEDFAKLVNAELYFAIKIRNHWIFLSSQYIRKQQFKITLQEDSKNSELNILGEKSFGILKPITFKSTYNQKKVTLFENQDWGFLTKYSIQVGKIKTLKKSITSEANSLFYRTVLEALQRFASNHSQQVIKIDNNKTLVIEKLEAGHEFKLSHFLLAPIRLISHDIHGNYDLTTYVTEIFDERKDQLISSNMVIGTLFELHEKGLDIVEVREGKLYPINDLYERDD